MTGFEIAIGIAGIVGAIAAVVALFWTYKGREPAPLPGAAAPPIPPPSPAAPPAELITNMAPQNLMFTGRDENLARLAEGLDSGAAMALTAVYGTGGVGKTAIALEYCHHYRGRYDVIWWVQSEGVTLERDLARLAISLGLVKEEAKNDEAIAALNQWLSSHGNWLLVFDNARDPDSIRAYIPPAGQGHVVITSRNVNWGGLADELPVAVMEPEEAVDFLIQRAKDKDRNEAAEVAETLGRLPLALVQAEAYIFMSGCGCGGYLKKFGEYGTTIFEENKPHDYGRTVFTTYQVSIDAVAEKTHAAPDLIKLLAFCGPDDLPLDTVRDGVVFLPPKLAEDVKEPKQFDRDIMALREFSLITVDNDLASMHRILQEVLRDHMKIDERKVWAEAAVKIVNEAFPFDSDYPENWPMCNLLLDHARVTAAHAEGLQVALEQAGGVLGQAGIYLHSKASFAEAEPMMRRSLAIGEDSFGPGHPKVAIRLNNLAQLLQNTDRLADAEPMMRRALAIDEASFGPEHPNVATDFNNLAALLKDTDRLAEAEPMMRRALAIDEASFGPEHPDVATDLNNLATLLKATDRLAEAEPMMKRVIEIMEKSFGKDHPNVAVALNNLAQLLQATDRLAEAEPMMRRALAIDEASFGPEHPNVAICLNNLARLLQDTNRLAEAEPMMRRAVGIWARSLGDKHPSTIKARKNLRVMEGEGEKKGRG